MFLGLLYTRVLTRQLLFFSLPAGSELATAYDYAGDVLNIKCVFDMKQAKNGDVLMGTNRLVDILLYVRYV